MPNSVYNRLIVSGAPAEVERFAAGVSTPDCCLDFERLVPTPKELLPSRGQRCSDPLWLPWRLRNWGTKWNAMDPEVVEGDAAGGRLVYDFTTANGAPDSWLQFVSSLFPSLEFLHECGEEFDHFAGRGTWKAGESIAYQDLLLADLEWIESEDERADL